MEARLVETAPSGDEWWYEPKWDGFRCLIFKDGDEVYLQSKSGQPLARYFPEVVELARQMPAAQGVLDGELVIPTDGRLSFDTLLLRLHPAASRVAMLAREHPATLIVFDLLVDAGGELLTGLPQRARRTALEHFAATHPGSPKLALSPGTPSLTRVQQWHDQAGSNLDGIIAKRRDMPYASGQRTGMAKVKTMRTADCVVGGFRYAAKKREVGSLLLGLFDDDGLLHHTGFCSGLKARDKPDLTKKLEALSGPPGFTGRHPGGPSRWSTERSTEWQTLRHELVVEVEYDHFTGGRFRHGTRLVRWRPDKDPRQCSTDQLPDEGVGSLRLLRSFKQS